MRNNFHSRFKRFIQENALFTTDQQVLLAVSGGVDSVVMAYLFHKAGYRFAIAHGHFQLRGAEADADEAFVKELAQRLEVPFFSIRFKTKKYAAEKGISIQMAARDLRYAWFNKLLVTNSFQYIATAHHKNDMAETVLLNLTKGSVLKGLHGILPKNNLIIRPLLWASKNEIREYAGYKKYAHREDKSNADSKYQRNLIRNEVIPLLEQINPDIAETIYRAAQRRWQLETWANAYSDRIKEKIVKALPAGIEVSIADLNKHHVPPQIFFEWVEQYGFNYIQVEELFGLLEETETRFFMGAGYRLSKDRAVITIEKEHHAIDEMVVAFGQVAAIVGATKFAFEHKTRSGIKDFNNPDMACLDERKIQFPLSIRKWRQGDSFKPFGLRGHKKISDFLTDLKLPFQEKENQLVVCSGQDICWVVGKRIDERFKVGEATKKVFKIETTFL